MAIRKASCFLEYLEGGKRKKRIDVSSLDRERTVCYLTWETSKGGSSLPARKIEESGGEEDGFGDTEHATADDEADVSLNGTGAGRNGSPESAGETDVVGTAQGQERKRISRRSPKAAMGEEVGDVRVLDLSHDHVRRDLEGDVTGKENRDTSLVLGEGESEVLFDARKLSCRDVLTVEVVEDVKEDHHGLEKRSPGYERVGLGKGAERKQGRTITSRSVLRSEALARVAISSVLIPTSDWGIVTALAETTPGSFLTLMSSSWAYSSLRGKKPPSANEVDKESCREEGDSRLGKRLELTSDPPSRPSREGRT
jgi:hypothetical protein